MHSQLIAYLQTLRPIPPSDINIVTSHFIVKNFKEGEYLVQPNKIAREVFFVCSGVIRIGSVNEKGLELTHFFYSENHLSSIIQSFNDEIATPAFIQACCTAEVLSIRKNKLLELYAQLPYIKDIVTEINQKHLIEKVNTRNMYLGEDAESRYKLFMTRHPDIASRVALKDVASYLGITPQSLSRIRKSI